MPNSSSKALARIRAQYDAQQAAINARRRALLSHLVESPINHWSGVRQDVLEVLRSNRDALTSIDNGAYAPVEVVSNSQFFFPRLAPQVGSLVA